VFMTCPIEGPLFQPSRPASKAHDSGAYREKESLLFTINILHVSSRNQSNFD
jgi:hypothetical protein